MSLKEVIKLPEGGFKIQEWLWQAIIGDNGAPEVRIYNSQNFVKKFYEIIMGKYFQPVIVQEPDLAFELPKDIGDGKQKLAGIITDDGQRFSLTNYLQQNNLTTDELESQWNKDEMSLKIKDEIYYLQFLYEPDKNRIINYVGLLSKNKRIGYVHVYEMELLLTSLYDDQIKCYNQKGSVNCQTN